MDRTLADPKLLDGEYIFRRYGATLADYERLADEDSRVELLDGVLIVHAPANVRHEREFRFLLSLLQSFATARRLGEVFGSRTPMILDVGDERRFEPDLLFIKRENLARLDDVALHGPADLVIEILSPATRDYDLGEKREAYTAAGVPELWFVDPDFQRFLAERPAGNRIADLTHGRFESLALEGFWLEVDWLWQSPLPDPTECLARILGRAQEAP